MRPIGSPVLPLPRFFPLSLMSWSRPDVGFVRQNRLLPPAGRTSYLRVVPDLVAEIR